MHKRKSHGATEKRFKVTKTGKVLRRARRQDHFNARDSGKVTRNKRRDVQMSENFIDTIKVLSPYHK